MKHIALLVVLASVLAAFACEDDSTGPPPPRPPGPFDPIEKWHVLNNIEYAYQKRRIEVYDKLLADEFIFQYPTGNGDETETWVRVEELSVTSRLFQSNQQSEPPVFPVCRTIRLDLVFDVDNMLWVAIVPDAFPEEIWYVTTIPYTFFFQMEPSTTFVQNNGRAQFAVRNAGTESAPHWELAELQDRGVWHGAIARAEK